MQKRSKNIKQSSRVVLAFEFGAGGTSRLVMLLVVRNFPCSVVLEQDMCVGLRVSGLQVQENSKEDSVKRIENQKVRWCKTPPNAPNRTVHPSVFSRRPIQP